MKKLKAILVDDEQLALEFLERKLQDIGSITIVEKYIQIDIHQLESIVEDIDIAFLDVEMPHLNGLELAELILAINPQIHIVFVTAFSQYAVEAFELNAIDYIIKPAEVNRLKQTIDRIETAMKRAIVDRKPSTNILQIQLCHEFSIKMENNKSEIIKWRTSKAKEVFLYLLHHRGELVRKSTLIELIWSDFEPDKAFPQLYTTVYHIRNTLHTYENHISIKNVMDGYILTTNNVQIDIYEWSELVENLPPISEDTINAYETTMALYKGGYLENENYMWLASEQYRLNIKWAEVAHKMAHFYRQNNNLDKAEEWYRKISGQIPEDEQAQFSLMKIYHQFNYRLLVEQQYRQLQQTLEELDTPMNPEIESWYEEMTKKSTR